MSRYILTEYQSDMTAASRVTFDCGSHTFRLLSVKSIDGQIIFEVSGQGLHEKSFMEMIVRLQKLDDNDSSGLAVLCDNCNFNRHMTRYRMAGYQQQVFDTFIDVARVYPYQYHKREVIIGEYEVGHILRSCNYIYRLYFGEKIIPIYYDAPESETICL